MWNEQKDFTVQDRRGQYEEAVNKCQLKEGYVLLEDPYFTWEEKSKYSASKTESSEKNTQGPHLVLKSNAEGICKGDILWLSYQTKPVPLFLNQDLKEGYRVLLTHTDSVAVYFDNESFDENWMK
jgi:hypothetical protein